MTGLPSDAMSDVLALVRMSGELVCLGDYAAPWGLRMHPGVGHFHIVLAGTAWLLVDGMSPLHLAQGDLVLLAQSSGHVLASDPGVPVLSIEDSVAAHPASAPLHHRIPGPGPRSELICGRFSFTGALVPRLVTVLPKVIHLAGAAIGAHHGLQVTTRYLLSEAQNPTPGSAIMIDRLLDLLFVQVVRDWGARSPHNLSWLGGLRDERIGRALSAIHQTPAHDWTVADLAALAGLSRSAFAIRFTDVVGQTPLRYVAQWRLDRAADHLRSETLRIAQIAVLTGYGSEAALSRAFKRRFGVGPVQFRRGGGTVPAD